MAKPVPRAAKAGGNQRQVEDEPTAEIGMPAELGPPLQADALPGWEGDEPTILAKAGRESADKRGERRDGAVILAMMSLTD